MLAEGGHTECVKWTLDNFPQMMISRNEEGYSALHSAASNGHIEVLKILQQYGMNPNKAETDYGGMVIPNTRILNFHQNMKTLHFSLL